MDPRRPSMNSRTVSRPVPATFGRPATTTGMAAAGPGGTESGVAGRTAKTAGSLPAGSDMATITGTIKANGVTATTITTEQAAEKRRFSANPARDVSVDGRRP